MRVTTDLWVSALLRRVFGAGDDAAVLDARLEREKKFDSDIWVVEIEAGSVPVEELLSVKTP